jgi:4-amino-4-deoxy-L-arabinose transferase-like glycosyltransferase
MPSVPPALRHRLLIVLLALFAAGTSLLISSAVLDRIPHVTDGVSYAFQGKIFASGRLFLEPPPVPALYAHENVLVTATRWCSKYPPGWPLLLAIGWLIGAPWIIGPLLLGLSVIGAWRLGRALFDPATGWLAAAALAVSPFALMMSAGFLAHGPALCAGVWCLALLAEGMEGGRRGRLAAAGLLGGLMFLIRPFTAVALLGPAVVWALARLRRSLDRRRFLAATGWIVLGALPCAAAFLFYNRAMFGGALTSGYTAYDAVQYGSVAAMSVSPGEALARNLPWYLAHLNRCLWGFPWPDLLVFLPLLWPRRPGRGRDAMLAACAASLILGHCFYFYRDVIYSGPRFAFEALGPLSILAARSLLTVYAGLGMLLQRVRAPEPRRLLRLAVAGIGCAILLFFPLGRRLPAQMVRHSQWYLAVSGEPLRRMAEAGVGRDALVFVSGTPWCYSALFLANDFPLTAGRVLVRDIPPLRQAALRAYPRREVWQARVIVDIPDPENAPDVAKPVEVSWTRLR